MYNSVITIVENTENTFKIEADYWPDVCCKHDEVMMMMRRMMLLLMMIMMVLVMVVCWS